MTGSCVRAFLALPLAGTALVRACAALQRELAARRSAAPPDVRWVMPEDLHVTVRFLGNLARADLPRTVATMTTAASLLTPPTAAVRWVGGFEPGRQTHLVVLGLQLSPPPTAALAWLDRQLLPLGIVPERRAFRPHVTLARLRRPTLVQQWVADVPLPAMTAHLPELALFHTQPTTTGARYTRLATATLTGS